LNNKELILGDLSQEQMIKKSNLTKLNRSIKENWGLGKLKTFLTYKAKLHDVKVVYINEAYTSKTCSNCGNQKSMELSKRVYKCKCGMTLDRDINSSINIFNKYNKNKTLNYKNINQVTTLHFHFGKLVA
ncbi:zinc ribbon domain-containing protein, partial [Tepidibacter thalassicus]